MRILIDQAAAEWIQSDDETYRAGNEWLAANGINQWSLDFDVLIDTEARTITATVVEALDTDEVMQGYVWPTGPSAPSVLPYTVDPPAVLVEAWQTWIGVAA